MELEDITTEDLQQALARKSQLEFIRYCWRKSEEFKIGLHTRAICEEIDTAFDRLRQGLSTYLAIMVPFRHGKSDLTSRFLPAHFLGEFPGKELMVLAYATSLVSEFSKDARTIVNTEPFQELYPEVFLTGDSRSVSSWSVNDGIGKTSWSGLRSGCTGKGASLLVIDDFFSGRADAESPNTREKTWNGIMDDAMTRLAPAHIVIITATPWHVDDPFGRIKAAIKRNILFFPFKFIKFPAFSDNYPTGTLFPERYPMEWYVTQKAGKSQYSFNSLMQMDPSVIGENMLRVDKIRYIRELPEGLHWVRAWDLASSEKQLIKDDPDYTVGIRVAVRWIPTSIPGCRTPILIIHSITRGRWKASTRNDIIKDTAIAEPSVRVGTEAFGAYKDAYTTLRDVLMGVRHVEQVNLPGSKTMKMEPLVAPFEAGNVWIYDPLLQGETEDTHIKPKWIDDLIDEVSTMPFGGHDDQGDALAMGFDMAGKLSGELVHSSQKMVNNNKIEGIYTVFNGFAIENNFCYVVTCQWNTLEEQLHVNYEAVIDTIENIEIYVKSTKKSQNIAPKELNSDSSRNIMSELSLRKIVFSVDETVDMLSSLYYLNGLIDQGKFTINSQCRDLILGIQNATDIKDIPSHLKALLYVVNNINVRIKMEKYRPDLKPFTKEKTRYIEEEEKKLRGLVPVNNKNTIGWH